MNKFLDVIKIDLPNDLNYIFGETYIDKAEKDDYNNALYLRLYCDFLVPYKKVEEVKNIIKKQKLHNKYNVIIDLKYNNLNSQNLYDSYEEINEYILEELRDTNKVYYNLFKYSKVDIKDNLFTFSFYGNEVLKPIKLEIINYIKDLYKERFNIEINVKLGADLEANELNTSDHKDKETNDNNKGLSDNEINNDNVYIENTNKSADSLDNRRIENVSHENTTNDQHTSHGIKSTYRNRVFNDDDKILYGIKDKKKRKLIDISDANVDMTNIIIRGEIINVTSKNITTKVGEPAVIYTIGIKNENDFINAELFLKPEHVKKADNKLKVGIKVEIGASIQYSKFSQEYIIKNIIYIEKIGKDEVIHIDVKPVENSYDVFVTNRKDDEKVKRVELHLHTKLSSNDGISSVEGVIAAASKFNMPAVAITDHGTVFGISDAYQYIEKKNIKNLKLINGIEGYLVNDDYKPIYNIYYKDVDEPITTKSKFVIFNIVTTGTNVIKDDIIKIEALKVENSLIIGRFSKIIKTNRKLDVDYLQKHNIRLSDIKEADDKEKVFKEFIDFINDDKVYLVSYDIKNKLNFIKKVLACADDLNKFVFIDLHSLVELSIKNLKTHTYIGTKKFLKISDAVISNLQSNDDSIQVETYTNFLILSKYNEYIYEKYLIEDLNEVSKKFSLDDESIKKLKYYHIILLAKNDLGRVNLYKIVSESNIHYKHNTRPMIPRSLIMKYREGLLIGSACVLGEFVNAIITGASDDELMNIASFYDYLEIQPVLNNSFLLNNPEYSGFTTIEDLENIDKKVIEIGDRLNKLVVATCDAHYIDRDEKVFREILRSGFYSKKKNRDKDNKILDSVKQDMEASNKEELYFRTTKEMLDEFRFLGIEKAYEVVVKNTNLINDMIEYVDPIRPDKCPPIIEGAEEELTSVTKKRLDELYGENPHPLVLKRYHDELKVIIDNDYSMLYIAAKKCIDYSLKKGYPVGSRGSVGSSIIAFLLGVSEVNPLPPHYVCPNCHHTEFDEKNVNITGYDLPDKICPNCGTKLNKDGFNCPFETFLGVIGGKPKEPDIDLNFSSEIQNDVHRYTKEIFGEMNSIRAGTVLTIKRTTAEKYVIDYAVEKAISLNSAYKKYCTDKIIGNRSSNGKHAGGTVVVPDGEYIETFTPLDFTEAEDISVVTTLFDYHKIDANLLKLDLLGHTAPTLLKRLSVLTGKRFEDITFDQDLLNLFTGLDSLKIKKEDIGGTRFGLLTIPEFGTDNCMNICEKCEPKTIADIVRISGLSHGENVWQDNVELLMDNKTCRIDEAICCRDDIMVYLESCKMDKRLGFDISERVRKGKHLTEEDEKAMRELNIPEWYIDSCNKIKYMFPKAHAAAYVLHALKLGYYKIHYPVEYYTAYFSVKSDGFDMRMVYLDKAEVRKHIDTLKYKLDLIKNRKVKVKAEEDNDTSDNKKDDDENIVLDFNNYINNMTSADIINDTIYALRVVEEIKARNIDFAPIDIYKAKATEFTVADNKIMPSFVTIKGLGEEGANRLEAEAKAAQFTSIADVMTRAKLSKANINLFMQYGILDKNMKQSDKISMFDYI